MSYTALPVAQSELESITWLPHPGIRKSVQSLGPYELGQAWSVGYHTMRTLLGCRNPIEWPTVRMWQGYETALATYLAVVCEEMYRRRFAPESQHGLFEALLWDGPRILSGRVVIKRELVTASTRELQRQGYLPPWFGWRPLHRSHRIALHTGDITVVQWPWERNINGSVRSRVLQAG